MSENLVRGGAGALGRQLARSGVTALAIHVGGAGLTYCAQLVIARSIGAHGFGVYAYVLAWATLLAYCAALGFDVSMLRFVAAYRAQGSWGLLRGVIRYGEHRALASGICIAFAGSLLATIWAAGQPELARTFMAGLLLVPVLALLWIRAAIVRALGGVASALAPNSIVRDGTLLVLLGLASLVPGCRLSAPVVMGGTVVTAALALGLVSLAVRRRMPRAAAAAVPAYEASTWLRVVLPFVALGFADVAMNRAGVVLLGWTGRTTDAGIYALAFNIAFMATLPRAAINALFAPTISDRFVRSGRDALQPLATQSALYTLLGALGVAIPAAVFAGPVLTWFGHDFAAGVPALRILLLGQVVAAGAGSQLYLLTMTGHERGAALLALAMVVANVAAGACFIHLFGLLGAAIATTATLIVWNAAMAVLIWRRLRLLPGAIAALRAMPGTRAWAAGERGAVS